MTRKFKIQVPIFDWASLTVIFTDQMSQVFAMRGDKWRGEKAVYKRKETDCVMIFNRRQITHGTIAHECGHASMDILAESGIRTTRANDEAFAYLCDFLVDFVSSRLKLARLRVRAK